MILVLVTSCAPHIPDYIRAGHPYVRKIAGDYDGIVAAIRRVVPQQGFEIQDEINPSIYERRSGGEDQSRDILFISKPKRNTWWVVYSTYSHLNIFVHQFSDGAEVEVRYEAMSPISNLRNDKLADRILDSIQKELQNN